VVVVVDEPPQAASDSAISDTPPALAAFLAFLDSQAFTSLLVAFSAPEGRISAFYCNWLMPQNEQ
jgi:FPC/CPF motif-containing protein YcgG